MFNKLYLHFRRTLTVTVLFILIIHIITVLSMYLYITDKDFRNKQEDEGTQVSMYISSHLKMIEENVAIYCGNGSLGDAISNRTLSVGAQMQNIMSVDASIVDYIIKEENYAYMYEPNSDNIYRKYIESGEKRDNGSLSKWHLFDDIYNCAILSMPILDSEGKICSMLLLEISMDNFYNKQNENAYIYMNDKNQHNILVGNKVKTIDNIVKMPKEKHGFYYIKYSYPFSDEITINVCFSRINIYIKALKFFLIIMLADAFLFVVSIYVINKYLKYIDRLLSQLCIDMNEFIIKIDK